MDMTFFAELAIALNPSPALFLAHAGEVHASGGPDSESVLTAVGIVFLIVLGFRLVTLFRRHVGAFPGDDGSRSVVVRNDESEPTPIQERMSPR
jgi:hypothetical protein